MRLRKLVEREKEVVTCRDDDDDDDDDDDGDGDVFPFAFVACNVFVAQFLANLVA